MGSVGPSRDLYRTTGPQLGESVTGVARDANRCSAPHGLPTDAAVSTAVHPSGRNCACRVLGDGRMLDRCNGSFGRPSGHASLALSSTSVADIGFGCSSLRGRGSRAARCGAVRGDHSDLQRRVQLADRLGGRPVYRRGLVGLLVRPAADIPANQWANETYRPHPEIWRDRAGRDA